MSSTRAPRRHQAAFEQVAEHRVARRACRARSARRSGRRCGSGALAVRCSCCHAACGVSGSVRCGIAAAAVHARSRHASAERGGTAAASAWWPAARRARSARSSARQHRRAPPAARCGARRAWPSCSSRMSPAARPRVRRASTRCGSRSRGVEAAPRPAHQRAGPRRCSTGSRNGLRRPGRRAKEAGAGRSARPSTLLRARRSRARSRAGPSSEKVWRCAWLWFCTLWPRAHDLAQQRRVRPARAARCRRRWRARRARRAGRARAGVTSGSGPSSIVSANSRRCGRGRGQPRACWGRASSSAATSRPR